jgi:hypothetical protein
MEVHKVVEDCIVREYKLYGKETEQIGKDMRELLNDGYKTTLHYAADSVGHVLLEAIKEHKEVEKPKTKSKATKKEAE